jgi:diguanylate cyclase (GGDEF)-like protein/PAS domain S-box-containing protein
MFHPRAIDSMQAGNPFRDGDTRGAMTADAVSWAELAEDIAGLGYWRFDVADDKMTWSDGLYALLGEARRDPPPRKVELSTIDTPDLDRLSARIAASIETGEPFTSRFRQRRPDGSWRVFHTLAACERDADGAVAVIRGVVMDVTDQEVHRVLAENGNDVIIQTDLEGRIAYISPSVTAMSGFTPAELIGASVPDLVGEETNRLFDGVLDNFEAGSDRPARSVELMVNRKDGRPLWLESRLAPLIDPDTGQRIGATDVVRDITERKAVEARLELANVLMTTQMEASPHGIVVVDTARRIMAFNQRFADLWDVTREFLTGGDYQTVRDGLNRWLKDPDALPGRLDFFYDHPDEVGSDELELVDGRIIDRYTVPLLSPAGVPLGRAWFYSDVTQQKRSLAEALRAASRDPLTGLANRATFVEVLHRDIAKARRGEKAFAVIYLDLDHFKGVNDTLGHPVGDQLLEAVARRLRSNTRDSDTVARFGGDEFAIIVSEIESATDVATLADKLIRVIGEPFSVAGQQVYTGASIGIDLFGQGSDAAETLLSHADLALYQAKASGRSSYRFFTPSMDAEVRERVALAAELREALAGDQLFLLYQPQISLTTGRTTGLEALLRWRHPRLGVLRPDAFLSTAAQMGLMEPLGHWALWAAIRQAGAWLDAELPLPRLCVNLSATQFKARLALEGDITAALAQAAMPPALLEIELTEAALMTATREDSAVLPRLREAGVTIALDDFGSGHSSLNHLSRFPVDRIKIAQDFVRNLETSKVDAAIVKAAIGVALGLGVKVLAAGVETAAQAELLRQWNCAEAQGAFFCGPMAAEDVPSILVRRLADGAGSTGVASGVEEGS